MSGPQHPAFTEDVEDRPPRERPVAKFVDGEGREMVVRVLTVSDGSGEVAEPE